MSIISTIGRRHTSVRILYALIYTLLIAGAVTMVYPFLLMLSGSTKSAVDLRRFDIVPAFFYNNTVLYRKHMEGLFNESVDALNMTYDTQYRSFESIHPPDRTHPQTVSEWKQFLHALDPPLYSWACGYVQASVSKTIPSTLRSFKTWLADHISHDMETVNQTIDTDFVSWNAVFLLPEDYLLRRNMPVQTAFSETYNTFKQQQPLYNRYYFSPEGFYKKLFLKTQYSRDIAAYNQAHETAYADYDRIHLTRRVPADGTALEQKDWEEFVRYTLNLLWVRVDASALPRYQAFLQAKYGGIETLNRHYATSYTAFSDIPLIEEPPAEGLALSDWESIIQGWKDPDTGKEYIIPVEALRIHSLDFMFRDYLLAKHGSLDAINAACATSYTNLLEIIPPQQDLHYLEFQGLRKALRWEFATRNFRAVFEYLIFHGRGILNTAIYCLLSVLCALIVNPLAAYAMSRYRMPSTYKILLFLMLTMAFPPMVTQIPVFLMLRRFNLLNTFAALVLPGLANGYAIFLLKGFFDSLPRELYESAEIDGASEWTMFWCITMNLSKPILSVIALQAFTVAYSNFMFALLICQDEKMWTLMVWLYELQQRSGQAVVYASLIIAAIPTFIIFALCQKIIIRGIVVPVEK
jgi:multiple sugar transport system permease protein